MNQPSAIHSVDAKLYSRKYFETISSFNNWYVFDDLLHFVLFSQKDSVLDVGAGAGELYRVLKGKIRTYIGLDYSPVAVKLAKKKNIRVELGNAKKLKYRDKTFEKVISLNVLEHIYPEEAEQLVSEAFRVLKPHGQLVIQTSPTKYLMAVSFSFLHFLGLQASSAAYHVHFWSESELNKLLATYPFRRIQLLTTKQEHFFRDNAPRQLQRIADAADVIFDSKTTNWVNRNLLSNNLATDLWVIATK
jgi:ubiquinone/menaquinone biosynthesis C-methylase UbiE